jgi:hypothetical protein
MFRKTYLLIFVLIFVTSDSALGGRFFHRCRRVSCPCPCPCKSEDTRYCVRDMYMYFAASGPNLYWCKTYDDGCYNDNEYDDLWYGNPSPAPPQYCANDDCEYGSWGTHLKGAGRPPGHEHLAAPLSHASFTSKDDVCQWLNSHYPGGNPHLPCQYYAIPDHDDPSIVYYVVVIKANAPHASPFDRVHYFGVETGPLTGETLDDARNVHAKSLHGSVLSFDYRVPGAIRGRTALVLLR